MNDIITGNDSTVKFFTARELDSERFANDYLVEGVLTAGQPAILAGPKKVLKTSIGLDLGISLATGGMFLGSFRVNRKVRVGFMSGESGLATIQTSARRICTAAGKELADIDNNLVFTEWLPRFDSTADLANLERWIVAQGLEVVIIDPAYLCVPGEGASNLFVMGQMLRAASAVFERTGSTMILLHHTRKSGGDPYDKFAPLELESLAWAGFQEFARQWIMLNRREAYEPGSGQHRLWMSVGGSAGHSGLWAVDVEEGAYEPGTPRIWDVAVVKAAEARKQVAERKASAKKTKELERLEADMSNLLKTIGCYPQGETKNQLKSAAGLPTERFNNALARLLGNGRIAHCTVPKTKTGYPGFRLASTA